MPKVKNNKSAEYWRSRYKYIEEKMYSIGEKTSNEIKSIYDYTLANIEKDIAVWYQRFANNNGISYNEALQLMKSKELDELKWDVFEYIKKGEGNEVTHLWDHELENASAQFHINRLEALKIQLLSHCDKTFGKVDKKIEKALKEAYSEGYLRTAYELQKGLEIGFDVAGIDNKLLNAIIHKPWADDGSNFSERIWGKYRPTLVNRLHKTLTDCIIRGDNPNNLAEGIAKEFNASRSSASNLVMTEYAYFTSLSRQDCLKELDVEEFEIVETLDTHTCAICQEMDSKHYPMSQYIIGVTAPPFHPRCRGTTCPYFNDEFTVDETRAARDPITGRTVSVKDMSYKEWKDEFVKEHGQAEWDYYEKSSKNKKQDREQFERYKAILGENIPETLAEFQRIKYNDSEYYSFIKLDYTRQNQLISHPELKLPNAEKATIDDRKFTGYLFNPNSTDGCAKGKAFTSRLGYGKENYNELKNEILQGTIKYPSKFKGTDKFGDTYEQKIILYGKNNKPTNVIVGWKVENESTWMTSTYIKEVK